MLQGIVRGLAGPPRRGGGTLVPPVGAAERNFLVELFIQVRRDTSALLVEARGEAEMRELRADGEAMDRDQASAYARTQIAQYLALATP